MNERGELFNVSVPDYPLCSLQLKKIRVIGPLIRNLENGRITVTKDTHINIVLLVEEDKNKTVVFK